jgi:isoamylase
MDDLSKECPYPLGLSFDGTTARFAIYSAHAEKIELGLFAPHEETPKQTISLNRSGSYWFTEVQEIEKGLLYAYKCHGPMNEAERNLFNPDKWLLDPYARHPDTFPVWNTRILKNVFAEIIQEPPFDWENTSAPKIPKEDLVIYEMHVRGFTADPSSQVKARGTYAGMIQKIPYLKKLGVTAVELLPIHEFDECNCKNIDPITKKPVPNYWGYNTLSFFAPKKNYSSTPDAVTEFKTLVKELHKNNIEVILDVVFNHTGEGSSKDYAISWRGIDNQSYYMKEDFTGCGNTINSNAPPGQQMILDSLRYWVQEMHVDGFRFDLASVLTRGPAGGPIEKPPILEAIANDPILNQVKLIAEAWDAGGLYQVGLFPTLGPWSEWNGKYRDIARTFLKGTDGKAGDFASILTGSQFVYGSSSPLASVNFITAHDGFSLRDLFTYQHKRNFDNGEDSRDGNDQNDNWNCGFEGETKEPHIIAMRERQMRNHWLALILSQGIPMILMGDEYGHTRLGNNNPYVQDNRLNWFLWDIADKQEDMFQFISKLIAFRKAHPELSKTSFLSKEEIDWHGHMPNLPNWSSRFVAFSTKTTPRIYLAFNADHHAADIELPSDKFKLIVNTNNPWNQHNFDSPGQPISGKVHLLSHAALLAIET